MQGFSVFIVALLTAFVTSVGTVYVVERYDLLRGTETAVPDFKGLSEVDARSNAAASHIALLIAAREPDASAKPGTVIRQSAPAGQRVPHEYSLSVVLAEELPRVPKVTGVPIAAATQSLGQQGYEATVTETANDVVEKGFVFDQTPKADEPLPKGKTVALQVSTGPSEIELPKLTGMRIPDAQAALEKLGLKVTVRWISLGETPTGIVLSQVPIAGQKAKPGDTVQLSACR
jgi:serine/threonine-protein kinase